MIKTSIFGRTLKKGLFMGEVIIYGTQNVQRRALPEYKIQ